MQKGKYVYRKPGGGNEQKTRRRKSTNLLPVFAICFVLVAVGTVIFMNRGKLFSGKPAGDVSSPSSVQEVSSKEIIEADPDDEWKLRLVNFETPVADDFSIEAVDYKDQKVDSRILVPLTEMVQAAKKEQLYLEIVSGYRDKSAQSALFNQEVTRQKSKGLSQDAAEKAAEIIVARPGKSEHNTGLAVDILPGNWYKTHSEATVEFAETPEFEWLQKHAAEYGFVMRFAENKQNVTKITYEPWHYRYVGVEHAARMNEKGMCLEEYIKFLEENR